MCLRPPHSFRTTLIVLKYICTNILWVQFSHCPLKRLTCFDFSYRLSYWIKVIPNILSVFPQLWETFMYQWTKPQPHFHQSSFCKFYTWSFLDLQRRVKMEDINNRCCNQFDFKYLFCMCTGYKTFFLSWILKKID